MDKRRLRIGDLNQKITSLEYDLRSEFISLGQELYSHHKNALGKKEEKDLIKEADNFSKEIKSKESTILKIRKMIERRSEIEKELSEIRNSIKEIEEENEELFERIGEAAYAYFQDNPSLDSKYLDFFTGLADKYKDIQQTKKELARIKDNIAEKPFLEKVFQKSKEVYLSSKLNVRTGSLAKSYRELGRSVCESDFINQVDDKNLNTVAAPYFDNMENKEALTKREQAVLDEEKQLREELEKLGAEKHQERRINELTEEIDEFQKKKEGVLYELASIFRKRKENPLSGEKAIDGSLSRIQDLEKQRTSLKKDIEKIQAAIDFDLLSLQVNEMEKTIRLRDEQIQNYKREIEELKTKINDMEQEKDRLGKISGETEAEPAQAKKVGTEAEKSPAGAQKAQTTKSAAKKSGPKADPAESEKA